MSCTKASEGLTRLTYYPAIEIIGGEEVTVPVGSSYVDAGCTATIGDEDVTSQVVTESNVNTNKIGLYSVSYSATNVDGFGKTVTRTVIVYDPNVTTDISGSKTLQAGSHRYRTDTGATTPFADYPITLTYVGPGIFYCNDFLGGWYEQRAGYGAAYACSGYISLNSDNTITMLSSSILPWGDTLDWMHDGVYDPVTGTTTWVVCYAGYMEFTVILK